MSIEKRKRALADMVRKHGFFEVAKIANLTPTTLGVYLDMANRRSVCLKTLAILNLTYP